MSEEDIKARYITPAITSAGWDIHKQIRLEYAFTVGRIILRGNITARGKQKRTDYVLFYKINFPLAIVEAKDNNHAVGAGLQQGIEYAKALDIPYVYASTGDAFVEQNLITGEVKELKLEEFPSPEVLYQRYLLFIIRYEYFLLMNYNIYRNNYENIVIYCCIYDKIKIVKMRNIPPII
ncbi:type I restriction enzyme HsdR N-terminal domain-containing protein [Alkalibaculum bacchi]|mgnify:FL=1|uniref:type I restriction enzyme HsdR N-terminal domain-containing protein n=1 Tax=Alkalibaculum bacchi TaxID=645887 RepID=UPI0026EDC704|nr:type I restriction enzyme HsdR N-terminal domain-containing protein [Alkalibaculum bacchi]